MLPLVNIPAWLGRPCCIGWKKDHPRHLLTPATCHAQVSVVSTGPKADGHSYYQSEGTTEAVADFKCIHYCNHSQQSHLS
ncbi:hypothetical protein EB796_020476 [Bugula neritina]|uniref:Uncharacterized protein n=1 Tax=Bugula neritina TaxID=10212 RepID=A0A7J7J5R7_BUGNE|nr:hypothetical protein EB796_020476 [Bugula neritina]